MLDLLGDGEIEPFLPSCSWCHGPVHRDAATCGGLCDRAVRLSAALCGLSEAHPYPDALQAGWRRLEQLDSLTREAQ